MRKPRVALIYTGGTIAMETDDSGCLAPPADPRALLSRLDPDHKISHRIELMPLWLCNEDSCNLTPQHWCQLADAVGDMHRNGAAAVVVIHGTDTMHYTASALALAAAPPLPVVFTGAQRPPQQAGSDAQSNFFDAFDAALMLIAADVPAAVWIAFAGGLTLAVHSEKTSAQRLNAFRSPLGRAAVRRQQGWHWRYRPPPPAATAVAWRGKADYRPLFSSSVLAVQVHPGLSQHSLWPLINQSGLEALVLEGLGSGQLPQQGAGNLLPLIETLTANDVPVLLVAPFNGEGCLDSPYASGRASRAAGVIATAAMTRSALYVKCCWLVAMAKWLAKDRRAFVARHINDNLAGEMLP